jgi:tRNA(Ile)-lysidine synthase
VRDWLQQFEAEIQNRRLFKPGASILVAVSGGLDSMTLLHALKELSRHHRWRLVVAHFNHQLRGRASEADEKFVRKTAEALRLPVVVSRGEVAAVAKASKISLEMAARKLRHEFLAREAAKRNIKTIALAHHAGDQVELFFLRLLRGAGGTGVAGMKWRSPSPADQKISVVRPLLDFSKAQLLAFAQANRIPFRHDATNSSTDFLRNRIRHELLPLLRRHYQPALDQSVLRLMEIVGAEAEFVGAVASSLRPDKVRPQAEPDIFGDLPRAIQRRLLQMELAEKGVAADFELIEALRQTQDRFVSVGANISVARDASGKVNVRRIQTAAFNGSERGVNLARPGRAEFGGRQFHWRANPLRRFSRPRQEAGAESFDAGKVGGKIILRHWRPGDRFRPLGLKAAVKLQDLFVNARISRELRRSLVVAEAAGGDIFWVEGLRISEGFKLTPDTKRVLVWRWRDHPA